MTPTPGRPDSTPADPTRSNRVQPLLDDQRRRWQAGDRVPARHYFDTVPGLAADPEAADLIYQEYLLGLDAGSEEGFVTVLTRHPAHAHELQLLHEADSLVTGAVDTPEGPNADAEFEVYEVLGRGGGGTVYRARDLALDRTVALKVLGEGVFATPEQADRFRTESLAAAKLTHPNVVPVYRTGTRSGRPFLSMAYIPGRTLAAVCRAESLSARRAAEVVATVARAVEYAHARHVLHRDLKPQNVIVEDETGRPVVTDFGLAKLLDGGHSPTRTGQMLGTPEYMAPEQADGRAGAVGPPTDVYGLGAILYECLTGRPPFRGDGPAAVVRQVLDREPVPPRRLNPSVPADLETVCLKCLQKSPGHRYPAARDVATDLDLFLAGRPILARPVGLAQRTSRWCRRNRLAAALIGLVVLTAVAGGALVGWQWSRAEREADTARRERDTADAERRRAEAHLTRATDAVDFIGRRIAEERLADVPHADPVRREVLEYAVRFYEGFLDTEGDSPAARRAAATAHLKVGGFRHRLGDLNGAADAFRSAVRLGEAGLAADPDDRDARLTRLTAAGRLCEVFLAAGRLADAEAADAEFERVYVSLPAGAASDRGVRFALADHFHTRGRVQLARRSYPEAERSLRAGEHEVRALLGEGGDDGSVKRRLAWLYCNLAVLQQRTGQNPAGVESYRTAEKLFGELARARPGSAGARFDHAVCRRNIGILLRKMNDGVAALAAYQAAREVFHMLAVDFPQVPTYRSEWAEALFGEALVTADRAAKRRLMERAIELYEQVAVQAPDQQGVRRRLVHVLMNYVELLVQSGDHAAAAKHLARLRPLCDIGMDFLTAERFQLDCVTLAEADKALSAETRRVVIDTYLTGFVNTLTRLRERNAPEYQTLLDDPRLKAYADHAGLKELLQADAEPRKDGTPDR
jgi:tetratricopeptide (TPR) repeat protein